MSPQDIAVEEKALREVLDTMTTLETMNREDVDNSDADAIKAVRSGLVSTLENLLRHMCHVRGIEDRTGNFNGLHYSLLAVFSDLYEEGFNLIRFRILLLTQIAEFLCY